MDKKVSLGDFKFLEELGRGSFGVVHKVQWLRSGLFSVIKCIHLNELSQQRRRDMWEEVRIMKDLQHPHIVRFETSFLENGCLYIVMEHAEGGDLHSVRGK